MAVRGGGGHTKSYVLLFIKQEKSEFSQSKVWKKSANFIDSHVWEPCTVYSYVMLYDWCKDKFASVWVGNDTLM